MDAWHLNHIKFNICETSRNCVKGYWGGKEGGWEKAECKQEQRNQEISSRLESHGLVLGKDKLCSGTTRPAFNEFSKCLGNFIVW